MPRSSLAISWSRRLNRSGSDSSSLQHGTMMVRDDLGGWGSMLVVVLVGVPQVPQVPQDMSGLPGLLKLQACRGYWNRYWGDSGISLRITHKPPTSQPGIVTAKRHSAVKMTRGRRAEPSICPLPYPIPECVATVSVFQRCSTDLRRARTCAE